MEDFNKELCAHFTTRNVDRSQKMKTANVSFRDVVLVDGDENNLAEKFGKREGISWTRT